MDPRVREDDKLKPNVVLKKNMNPRRQRRLQKKREDDILTARLKITTLIGITVTDKVI